MECGCNWSSIPECDTILAEVGKWSWAINGRQYFDKSQTDYNSPYVCDGETVMNIFE